MTPLWEGTIVSRSFQQLPRLGFGQRCSIALKSLGGSTVKLDLREKSVSLNLYLK